MFFHLLDTHPNLILFGVDSWMGINRDAYAKMKKEVNEKVVNYKNGMIMNMSTIEAAEKTPDASLDFVFIDADHSYPSCKIDMQKWLPKVKVGGYIIGHDCKVSSVKKAIEEVFGETSYETDVDQVWYVKERGFDKAEIAQYTGYIVVVFGILGNLFGGLGSDWFSKKFNLGRPMFLFWVMLLLLP